MAIICFNMDGTLSLVGDRVKYLPDWDSFYEACDEDKVNEPIADIFRMMKSKGHTIRIVTGRRESVRNKTLLWLQENDLYTNTYDLIMRPNGDMRHDTILKPLLVQDFVNEIEMVFEDRNSMVAKWREMGITCLQVSDGNF